MLARRQIIAAGLALPLLATLARAQAIFSQEGVALRGYDPVAYFTQGTPTPGSPQHAAQWQGATWHFASPRARATFSATPEAFAPQYGGYCAWAMAEGYVAPIRPDAWRIVNGKLYLNASRRIQRRWERDIPGHIARADANWPAIREDLLTG